MLGSASIRFCVESNCVKYNDFDAEWIILHSKNYSILCEWDQSPP